ncbi:unnamed protein product [Debaryomyces tyrocola]|nr:unnamed protein product [Debaryomyces tyrocola]
MAIGFFGLTFMGYVVEIDDMCCGSKMKLVIGYFCSYIEYFGSQYVSVGANPVAPTGCNYLMQAFNTDLRV